MKNAKKIFGVFSCYELGCRFASKKTGTCNDEACLAHPSIIEKETLRGDNKE